MASAHSTRELQSSRELLEGKFDLSKLDISKLPNLPALGLLPPGVQLPPLKDFLPPLESINLPPLNDFLKSVGLPSWEEMNLPPLSEFMKPVFDPEAVQLPNLQVRKSERGSERGGGESLCLCVCVWGGLAVLLTVFTAKEHST